MRNESSPAVRIKNLTYRYPGYNTSPVTALKEIDLEILEGEKVLITGPSGSGKSSLLRCINGLIPNSDKGGEFSGDVWIYGMNTREHSVPEISRYVGTVFQNPDYQIVSDRVDFEIAFGLENLAVPPEEIESNIEEIAELLKIPHLLERSTSELSWGEKQKVAIASVLVMKPKIIVLDEPFSGLDPASFANLVNLLNELNREPGITVIIVEHRTGDLYLHMDRIVEIEDGAIVSDRRRTADANRLNSPQAPVTGAGNSINLRDSLVQKTPVISGGNPAVELRDVSFSYPGAERPAISGLSLKINENEITVILGSNGSGKSTLAKHLNGTLKPDSGEVFLLGGNVAGTAKRDLVKMSGLVSQHADSQLFGENITEEFSFGPENTGMAEAEIERLIPEIISSLDLDRIDKNSPLLRLSAGQKQRIAIGSVLMMQTRVLVLDEPTIGLDHRLKENLSETLKEIAGSGRCVIVMTHDIGFAASCAQRVLTMDKGKITGDSAGSI